MQPKPARDKPQTSAQYKESKALKILTDHFDSQTDLVVCLEHADDAGERDLSTDGGGKWGVEDQVVSAVLLGGDDEVGPTVCHLCTSTVGGSHRGQG